VHNISSPIHVPQLMHLNPCIEAVIWDCPTVADVANTASAAAQPADHRAIT